MTLTPERKELYQLEDEMIIAMFLERSEQAIDQLRHKYENAVRKTVSNILNDPRDAEECVNDTFLRIWNTIPPKRPEYLGAYVCRTARNAALNRYNSNSALKRNSRFDAAVEELDGVLPSGGSVESESEAREIAEYVSKFLKDQPYTDRYIFLRYYWYADAASDIGEKTGLSAKAVSVRLFRIKSRLKKYLRKEGLIS